MKEITKDYVKEVQLGLRLGGIDAKREGVLIMLKIIELINEKGQESTIRDVSGIVADSKEQIEEWKED